MREGSSKLRVPSGDPPVMKSISLFKGIHGIQMLCALLGFLSLVLLYGIMFSDKGIMGYRQQRMQIGELESKVQKTGADNHRAFQELQDLKGNAEVQERIIRKQLGWSREGELVIEFLPPGSEKTN